MRTAAGLTIGGAAPAAGLALAQGNAPEPQRAIPDPPSGRPFATPGTIAIQDDDVRNPAMLWVEEGKAAWSRAEGAAAPPIDSRALNAITTGLALPSRGMPVGVDFSGPARPLFDAGERFDNTRRAPLDMRCGARHEDKRGRHPRADLLPRGMSGGVPTHRLKDQRAISLQGCVNDVRGQTPLTGGEEFTNLGCCLAWRAQGLPVESPSVRR